MWAAEMNTSRFYFQRAYSALKAGDMSEDFKIQGMDQAISRLRRLANLKKVQSIVRKASRQGMNIVRNSARQNAKAIDDPQTAEKIWKNIAVSSGKSRDPNELVMRVGVRGGASFSSRVPPKLSGGDTRHWRFIEFPTKGSMGVPFMRTAFNSNTQNVTNKFAEVFNTELDKELAL